MANGQGPLTDDDLNEMNARLAELDEADRIIVLSKQAGIDVKDAEKRSRDLREQISRIKQSFFTGR